MIFLELDEMQFSVGSLANQFRGLNTLIQGFFKVPSAKFRKQQIERIRTKKYYKQVRQVITFKHAKE